MTQKTFQKITQTIIFLGIISVNLFIGWAAVLHSHVSIISYISNKGW